MNGLRKPLAVMLAVLMLLATVPIFALSTVEPLTGVRLYGYRIFDDDDQLSFGWISFLDDSPAVITEEHVEENAFDDYSDLSAGAYVGGYVYGFAENDLFYKIDTSDWSRTILFGDSTAYNGWSDMTYDYTTGTLYAIAYTLPWESSESESNIEASFLVTIDVYSHEITEVAQITTGILTLAADDLGQLYGVAMDGCLYEIDKTNGSCRIVGSTGKVVEFAQSMCYDYNTDTMYWALCNLTSGTLCTLNLETGAATTLGTIGGNTEVVSLFVIPTDEPVIDVTGIEVTPETAEISVGSTTALTAQITPANATERTHIWTSSDNAVASVDADGIVTANSIGTAIITATSVDGGFTDTCTVTVSEASDTSDYQLVETLTTGKSYIIVAYYDGQPYALVNRNANVTSSSAWGAKLIPIVLSPDGSYVIGAVDSAENIEDMVWNANGDYTDGFTFMSATNDLYFAGLTWCNWTAVNETADRWLPIQHETSDGSTITVLKSIRAEEIDPTEPRVYINVTTSYYNSAIFDYCSINNASDISFYELSDGSIIIGDVDGDGVVTAGDALSALRHAMDVLTLSGQPFEAADFDGDGSISIADALEILRLALIPN